ncbi:serine/threonine-protein kinase [Ideonella sp. DXS29W]|uniref:Serine/threonine-protein kinase n=1 Tax=Ideonella lacteola TaxID=2984193 RepID=A0ABU9BN32_9BURK
MQRDVGLEQADGDARRWQWAKAALADALDQPTVARAAWLSQLRERDPALADEVASLLEAHAQTDSALLRLANGSVDGLVQAHADDRRIGQRLGAYRLVRRIGSGGMGDVYLGERSDGTFEKSVAVKVLRQELVGEQAVRRLERERQILASLDHVNLAKVFDGGVTEEGLPYFVMELVDGQPLTDYCDAHDLDVAQRVALMRAVCQVVHYVHQRGVIHRDLKPGNILVTPEGDIKLLDFGIAKLVAAKPGGAEETVTLLRTMTPLYSSPEQVRGQAIGPASDVYSLGIVMCALLAGRAPYDVDTTRPASFELARAICDEEPLRLSDAAAGRAGAMPVRQLRGDLDAVVAKALRKDPSARYASAEQMADDLFRHLERLPVGARRGATGYRLGRWLVRHRAVAAGALVANLALLAGLALALDQAHEAREQRQLAQQASARARSMANVALFDLDDAVAKLPGSIEARKLLVEKAQAYLTALESDLNSDPGLAVELAASYRKLGDIRGRPNTSNLGDFDGALASYNHSLALLQSLVGRPLPISQVEFDLERVSALGRKTSVLSYTAQRDAARQSAEQALALLDGVAAREPENTKAMTMRAGVHGVLSWVLHEQGDTAGFLAQAAAAEKQLDHVLRLTPDDNEARFNLAAAYARRGVYYLERDHTPESARLALEPLQKWTELVEHMSSQQPDNATYGGALAESRSYLGLAYERMNDRRRAIQVLRDSTDELTRRIQLNPRDEHLSFVLLNARNELAGVLLSHGDASGALDQTRLALALFNEWPEATRRNTMHLHSAAQAHFIAGQAQAVGDRLAPGREACEHFRASLSLLQGIPGELPASSNGELSRDDVQRAVARCRP